MACKTDYKMCRAWMERTLRDDIKDPQFIDPVTGEINSTALAEECADHFDAYEDRIDWTIPDHIWDAAADVDINRVEA